MPDENPSTDFFVFLKKKGFSAKTSPVLTKEKKMPLQMRHYSMQPPKYTFRQESPALTPAFPAPAVAATVVKGTSKTLIFLRVLLLVVLAALSVGLYYIYKNIKALDDAKKQVPHDLVILRDVVIVSTALVAFSLIVSFFF
jgi:hypothetical protein